MNALAPALVELLKDPVVSAAIAERCCLAF